MAAVQRRRSMIVGLYVCFAFVVAARATVCKGTQQTAFRVIWNSPTKVCETAFNILIDVTKYGMYENKDDNWMGDEISLFYAPRPGLYPSYTTDGTPLNGGLPQEGNLTAHIQRASKDITTRITDVEFKGAGVVDWESWNPIWSRNHGNIYQRNSKVEVKKNNPHLPDKKVIEKAKKEFEEGARRYMEDTLAKAKTLRPKGHWGFYGFPRCYNTGRNTNCSNKVMAENDRLAWLFNASTGLYPSAYLTANTANNTAYVIGQVMEAKRVRSNPDTPIYLYATYRQPDTQTFYTKAQLEASLQIPKKFCASGVILWGATKESHSRVTCKHLKEYVDKTLGPYVQDLIGKCRKEASTIQDLFCELPKILRRLWCWLLNC